MYYVYVGHFGTIDHPLWFVDQFPAFPVIWSNILQTQTQTGTLQ